LSQRGNDGGPAPIVVKKIKKGHGGHHGGAWKVAYADFVTAMMALFIVLWILGQDQETKKGVAMYFRDPGVFETGRGGIVGEGAAPVTVPVPGPPAPVVGGSDGNALERVEESIRKSFVGMPELAGLQDQVEIERTDEGLRIELLDEESYSFFERGQAELSPAGAAVLQSIVRQIATLPNQVVIEGHTDSQPFTSSSSYSNWELSLDRANSARRMMTLVGLPEERLAEIRGYADRRPRFPDHPEDFRNRRVSIVILNGAAPPSSAGIEAPGADGRLGDLIPTAPPAHGSH
jgi:chemotaxis protein MotB